MIRILYDSLLSIFRICSLHYSIQGHHSQRSGKNHDFFLPLLWFFAQIWILEILFKKWGECKGNPHDSDSDRHFPFCIALRICLILFVSISQILFQIYRHCRHFFRAFLSLDSSRIFQALPFRSRLFFENLLSNILEALDRLLSVRHFVLPRTHVAPGIIDNFIYLARIRAFFYQLCH